MYCRSSSDENLGCGGILILLLICVFMIFAIEAGTNASTETEWNQGICPMCAVRYELRAATNSGLKYYACPTCGQEVKRY